MANQLARDEAGNIWEVDAKGNPVRLHQQAASHGIPIKPAPPAYPYEGPQAAATLQHTQQEVQQTGATMAANESRAKSEAKSAAIKAQSDQIDLNNKMGTPPGDPSKGGSDYLSSLPQGVRDLTLAMLNNRYPAVINRNIPVVNQAVLAANHLSPAFDAAKYSMRVALLNKTLTGSDADELKALNTAITHAGVLYDQTDKLPAGGNYGIGPITHSVNAFENWLHSADPGLKNWLDTRQKYAQEESKTYAINAQGGQQETAANYDPNDPKATIKGQIQNDIQLLGGRMAAILNKYNIGNAGQAPLEPLSPDARAVLQRLAPQVLQKEFSQRPDPMAQAMGLTFPDAPPPPQNGGGALPPGTGGNDGGITTTRPIVTPPGTGASGAQAVTGSTDGFNYKPNPALAAFWAGEARNQVPYSQAIKDWNADPANKGMALTTLPPPGKYAEVSRYYKNNPDENYNPFQGSTLGAPMNAVDTLTNAAAQTGTGAFLGHYDNAITGNTIGRLAGPQQTAYFNYISRQQNPTASDVGDLAGTVGGAVLTGKAVKAAAPFLGPYGGIIGGSPTRAALTGDSIFGATSGYNQNPDNPFLGGVLGMTAMDAGNLGGRYLLGPAVSAGLDTQVGQKLAGLTLRGVNGAKNAVGGMFGRAPAPAPDFTVPPAPPVGLTGQTQQALPTITANLQDAQAAGLPYTLADADPRLGKMLASAGRFSPDVQANALNFLSVRNRGQAERAIQQIGSNLAPVNDLNVIKAGQIQAARQAAQPFYEQAYALPGRTSPQLEALLNTPAGKQAMSRAQTIAANEQRDPNALGFGLNDQGETVFTKNPSPQTIDYVKRGLDDILEQYRNPMTGDLDLDEAGRAVQGVKNGILTEADRLFPEYAQARAAYAQNASKATDAQRGFDATAPAVTPTTVQSVVNGLPDQNVPFFQRGYAANMAKTAGNRSLGGNPYNNINGTLYQQQKLPIVFPNGAANFQRAQDLEGDMGRTYQNVVGGSQTQNKAMDDKLFSMGDAAEAAMDGVGVVASGGSPWGMLPGLMVRKGIDAARFGMGTKKANMIAPYLLNPDPAANLDMINKLSLMQANRNAYLSRVGAASGQLGAGMFGAPILYLGSQN